MAETTVLFRGDAPGENATDFLNSIKRRGLTTPGWKDDDKIEYFELSLKTGSYARSWFKKLPATDKDTFKHLEAAFMKQWPEKEMAVKEKGEPQEELLSFVLPPAEIGVRIEEAGTIRRMANDRSCALVSSNFCRRAYRYSDLCSGPIQRKEKHCKVAHELTSSSSACRMKSRPRSSQIYPHCSCQL
jgi:hypothetical protein